VTTDVLLREVTEADLPAFFAHQLDPEATQMAAFPARDRQTFMAHWTKIMSDATVNKQTILVDGRVAGNIVCFEELGDRLVGYWIGKEYWGRGIATQALSAFLIRVSERPLYARVAKHNIGSIRVLEKCGFTIRDDGNEVPEAAADGIEEVILELG